MLTLSLVVDTGDPANGPNSEVFGEELLIFQILQEILGNGHTHIFIWIFSTNNFLERGTDDLSNLIEKRSQRILVAALDSLFGAQDLRVQLEHDPVRPASYLIWHEVNFLAAVIQRPKFFLQELYLIF